MRAKRLVALKVLAWIGCLVPLTLIVARGFGIGGTSLGANPVETVLDTMGKTGLNILLISLAVTPLRLITGYNQLVRLRRLLGLFSFFYIVLHFLTYAALDLRLEWNTLFVDITERPYITVGMLALLGLVPLAITSTKAMQRRLARRWVKLHRLVYAIAILGVVHFFWQVKADLSEPLVYAGILTLLLSYRMFRWFQIRRRGSVARDAVVSKS